MEKRNVPEIRFEGFTDDWEQYKLKDIANKVNEKNVNLSVSETFTNSAEYGVISQRDFFDHDISNVENIGGYYIVGEDNFVYNPRISVTAPVGPINRNKLGRKGIISPLYTIFKTHDIDPIFLEYFFKGNAWHSYMYFNGDTGARFDRFSIKNEVFFDMPIPYPQFEEQKIIGRYLDYLDRLVTLHQCKYEKLKLFKEAMLDKLFPKNDEKVPEIRFTGFTDDWEQRKLGECFIERTERSAIGELIAVTINSGVVKASKINRYDNSSEDKSNYKVVRKNDIAYNSMRMWQGASGYSQYDGILSPAYTVAIPKENIDSIFFSYMFKRVDLIHKFQINSQGLTSDTWNLKFPAFSKIVINVPQLDEQLKIGTYFSTIDRLITFHQYKYKKLKLFKEAMLNKMFI